MKKRVRRSDRPCCPARDLVVATAIGGLAETLQPSRFVSDTITRATVPAGTTTEYVFKITPKEH
jgi:hypothetical protein